MSSAGSEESPVPQWIYTICGVYLVVVGVLGVSINSLVCLLFLRCKQVSPSVCVLQ